MNLPLLLSHTPPISMELLPLTVLVAARVHQPTQPVTQQVYSSKRLFDLTITLAVLVLGLPVLLLTALLTWLTSPGPAIFTQVRIGQGGRPFTIFKFRSMYINAEQGLPMLSIGPADPRITPWGQFMRQTRLDELPQFVNVLLGDMSVVGPRPERQYFIDQITVISPAYRNLLHLKPGITSIGQVRFGYAASVPAMIQRMRYDQLYLRRQSLALDLWVVGQTLRTIYERRGQ